MPPPTAPAEQAAAADLPASVAVAIIGAGFAGLQAADTLAAAGITDIALLEAGPAVGGRVRSHPGLAPWPVEAGAEFVHGGNVALRRLLRRAGCTLTEYAWPDRWWFAGEGCGLVREEKEGGGSWCCCGGRRAQAEATAADPDLARVHALFAGVGAEAEPDPNTPDPSARAWLVGTHAASPRQVAIAEACYVNDFGADLESLGRRELGIENRLWDAGEAYLVSDKPLAAVAAHMAARLPAGRVRTGWPVAGVRVEGEEGSGSVLLTGPGGVTLRAGTAIIAVPLAVLQAGHIAFDPPLPPLKREAMARVTVGRAMKVILGFRARFWPPDFFDAVCPGSFVPEFWTVDGAKSGGGTGEKTADGIAHVMTGFLAGRFAAAAAALGEGETVTRALRQLDAMFGRAADPAPASASFVRAHVADWGADPLALGAYSIPSRGARPGDRAALAAPAGGGALLFAGEATHPAVNPCVQAALETGERAGREAIARVRRRGVEGRRWWRA